MFSSRNLRIEITIRGNLGRFIFSITIENEYQKGFWTRKLPSETLNPLPWGNSLRVGGDGGDETTTKRQKG